MLPAPHIAGRSPVMVKVSVSDWTAPSFALTCQVTSELWSLPGESGMTRVRLVENGVTPNLTPPSKRPARAKERPPNDT